MFTVRCNDALYTSDVVASAVYCAVNIVTGNNSKNLTSNKETNKHTNKSTTKLVTREVRNKEDKSAHCMFAHLASTSMLINYINK